MAIHVDTVASVRVVPDLSAFTQADLDDVAQILGRHVYGDGGPAAEGELKSLSACSLAAADLLEHFWIVPKA